VERLYAVFTARFCMALHHSRYANVDSMVTVAKAVAILLNMLTEKRHGRYVSRTIMAPAAQAATELDAGGDVSGGGAVGGEGEGVGNGDAQTPAAAGSAAGGTAGGGVGGVGGLETGLMSDAGGCIAGIDAGGGGAGAAGAVRTRLTPDGGDVAASVGESGGGVCGGDGGGTGLMAAGGGCRGNPLSGVTRSPARAGDGS